MVTLATLRGRMKNNKKQTYRQRFKEIKNMPHSKHTTQTACNKRYHPLT